jgi:ABC-type multidrug transport system permease subunit
MIFNENFNDLSVNIPVFYNSGFLFSQEKECFFTTTHVDLLSNLSGALIIIGGVLIGFSKEKQEDEYLMQLRLKAVFVSLLWSYSIVLLLFLTVFGMMFFSLMVISMFLPLVIYVFYWSYLLYNEK